MVSNLGTFWSPTSPSTWSFSRPFSFSAAYRLSYASGPSRSTSRSGASRPSGEPILQAPRAQIHFLPRLLTPPTAADDADERSCFRVVAIAPTYGFIQWAKLMLTPCSRCGRHSRVCRGLLDLLLLGDADPVVRRPEADHRAPRGKAPVEPTVLLVPSAWLVQGWLRLPDLQLWVAEGEVQVLAVFHDPGETPSPLPSGLLLLTPLSLYPPLHPTPQKQAHRCQGLEGNSSVDGLQKRRQGPPPVLPRGHVARDALHHRDLRRAPVSPR